MGKEITNTNPKIALVILCFVTLIAEGFIKKYLLMGLIWGGLVVFGLAVLIIEIKDWKNESKAKIKAKRDF